MQDKSNYEKQYISVDISLFSIINNELNVLLIKRAKAPYQEMWSLVGGLVNNNESCEQAVIRELYEKIGIKESFPILSGVFSNPKRDIRFRNISVSYYCLTHSDLNINKNLEKALNVKWFSIKELPNLAFDHNLIVNQAIEQLKLKVYDIDYLKNYLPNTFTLSSLQKIYESILQTQLDKRNFRRKLNSLNCLENTGEKNEQDSHKKSIIYKFK